MPRPTISSLFNSCRPSAVLGTVWTVVVDTVNAMALWTFAHILEKGREGIAPAITDGNASSSIVFIAAGAWDVAAGFHAHPDAVFGGAAGLSMRQSIRMISPETSTRHRVFTLQCAAGDAQILPAFAGADVADFALRAFRKRLIQDRQASEHRAPGYLKSSHMKCNDNRIAA